MSMSLVHQRGVSTRAPSIYGGAGGFETRISRSVSVSGSGSWSGSGLSIFGGTSSAETSSVIGDEKMTMQNLNDRLSSYLEKVRSLEAANSKLELQIQEFYDKRSPQGSLDYSAYFSTISELRAQICSKFSENQRIVLQVDNARMAADDFKIKCESEVNLRLMVEGDIVNLRRVRDEMTLSSSDLELQMESLKQELVFMKKTHEEDLSLLRVQSSGGVNVEVDSGESVNLLQVLEETRQQYETVMTKNKVELEKWFQSKVETLQKEIKTSTTEVKTFSSELTELKRTYQSLEISHQSACAQIKMMQQSVEEVKGRYSQQLSQLQATISTLEVELQELRGSMEQLQTDYNLLLDIRMRLELEIAEYRRLLEMEYQEQKELKVVTEVKKVEKVVEKVVEVVEVVEEVEEYKPHIEKRIRTIVEEIVDGKVVSSTMDTQVESIQ